MEKQGLRCRSLMSFCVDLYRNSPLSNLPMLTRPQLTALPKTETHLHIEGALPYELLQGLDPVMFKEVPETWADDYKFPDFPAFESHLISLAMHWFDSPERYHEAAKVLFSRLVTEGVRYVETSFHAGMIQFVGIPGPDILAAIREAAPQGLEVRVFLGMSRPSLNDETMRAVEDCVNWDGLAGIDLHGVEPLPIEDWTRRLWPAAREAGLVTKAHAGEFAGAKSVREVIEVLGVRRIQHGVRAAEDAEVLALCRDVGASFDVCPISNVKLDVVPTMADHPLRRILKAGVPCTISTDDPMSFGNVLLDEYEALQEHLSFTPQELANLVRTGFANALVEAEQRDAWLGEVMAWEQAIAVSS